MNGLSINQILSDRGFRESELYPLNASQMENSEFNDRVIQAYGLYQTREVGNHISANYPISQQIFSCIATLDNLKTFLFVSKRWNYNVIAFTKYKWDSLMKAENSPKLMSAEVNEIEKKFSKKSGLFKFGVLLNRVEGTLKNQPIHLIDLEACEKYLQSKKEEKPNRALTAPLPDLDITALLGLRRFYVQLK